MKFRNYLNNLKRILSVWSEFSLCTNKTLGEFHFLICHKIFWAYLRQGLFKNEFVVSFPMMLARHPHPIYMSFAPLTTKEYFNKDKMTEALLYECGFTLFEDDTSNNKTNYYFREAKK